MKQRTKIIVFVVIILALVIIFGVGIGVKQGWFAGLADVIQPQEATGGVEVTLLVADKDDNPIVGVLVTITKPENFAKESVKCLPTDTSSDSNSPKKNGDQAEYPMGKTGADGKVTFTVTNARDVNYLRVSKEEAQYKSCAFRYSAARVSPPSGNVGPSEAFPNQSVVYFKNIVAGSTIYIKFHLRSSGGGGGGDNGTISGNVKYLDNGAAIEGAVLNLYNADGSSYRLRAANTDASGFYKIDNLPNATYKIKVQGKACDYKESNLADVVVSTAQPNPTVNFNLEREVVPAWSAKIYGQITDSQNKSVGGAKVRLYNLTSSILADSTESDNQGNYSFCPVVIGQNYKVSASKLGYLPAEETVENLPAGLKEINLSLTPILINATFNLSGTIKGKPDCGSEQNLAGMNVIVLDADNHTVLKVDNSPATATTDNNGFYRIDKISMIDSQGRTAAKINVQSNFYYNSQDFAFTPQANQNIVVNGTLNGKNLKVSISGQVKEDKAPVKGAKIYLIDSIQQTQIAETDSQGNYQNNNLSPDYIGREVTIKAEIERNGQKYSDAKRITFQCQNTVNLAINSPQTKDVKVQVKKDSKGVNGATVTLEIAQDNGFLKQSSQKTAKIDKKDGLAIFQVATGSTFRFSAVKENQSGKSGNYSLPPFNPDREIAVVNLLGPVEGSDNLHVVYHFYFHQQIDRGDTSVKEIFNEFKKTITDWKRLVRIAFDPWAKFQWLGEEAHGFIRQFANKDKEEPLSDFIKIDKGLFNRSNWKFKIAEWKLPDTIKQMISSGQITIDWGKLGFPKNSFAKGTLGRAGENSSSEYTVDIVFPDLATKKAWVKNIFCAEGSTNWNDLFGEINDRNLNLALDTNGDQDKIIYTKVKVACGSIQPIETKSDIDIYRVDVALRYRFTRAAAKAIGQVIIDLDKGQITPERAEEILGGGGFHLSPDQLKAVIKPASQSQQQETTATAPSYPFENGLVYIPEISPGSYKIDLKGNDNYQIDNRTSSFQVKDDSDMVTVEPKLCYKDAAIWESNIEGINLKTFSLNGLPYFMSNVISDSKAALEKAGVTNLVFLGDSYNAPESSAHAVDTNLNYCRAGSDSKATPEDKQISGRSIVIEAPFVSNVTHNYDAVTSTYMISSQFDRQAGFLVYQDLSNTQKKSWRKIKNMVENLDNPNPVYEKIISASMIGDYISRPDLYQKPDHLFALTVAAYKENGEILKAQIDNLADKQQKNALKAMVKYVIETVGANPGDENLYPSMGRFSSTDFPSGSILSGSVFKENYAALPLSQKIKIRYYVLLSSIKNSKLVQWFSNWGNNRSSGRLEITITKNNEIVSNALVTIGEKKSCTTDATGFCTVNLAAGDYNLTVKDKKTNQAYNLIDPEISASIVKNKTTAITIKIIE